MRNLSYRAYFRILIVGPVLWENERGRHMNPFRVQSFKTQPKCWPAGWTILVKRYLEIMFSKLSGLSRINGNHQILYFFGCDEVDDFADSSTTFVASWAVNSDGNCGVVDQNKTFCPSLKTKSVNYFLIAALILIIRHCDVMIIIVCIS